MYWYFKVLMNYACFQGRSRRKEYWMFVLLQTLFTIAGVLLDVLLGTTIEGTGYGWIAIGYVLATFLPALAVSVRRLHDVGKSGWLVLVSVIPVFGTIWLWGLMSIGGKPGYNRYGPNPRVMEARPA